jgi:hypothetical protein
MPTFIACAPTADDEARAQAEHIKAVVAAGGVVDSILPIAEHLRRFRAGVGEHPGTFRDASPSIDALAERFVDAIARNDTAALRRMVLDRAEFAWLYYPSSHVSRPPYEAPPHLLWGQILAASNEGVSRALVRYGGRPLRFVAATCAQAPRVEDANRLHERCVLTLRDGDAPSFNARLFGSVIERDGRFKLISFANDL